MYCFHLKTRNRTSEEVILHTKLLYYYSFNGTWVWNGNWYGNVDQRGRYIDGDDCYENGVGTGTKSENLEETVWGWGLQPRKEMGTGT